MRNYFSTSRSKTKNGVYHLDLVSFYSLLSLNINGNFDSLSLTTRRFLVKVLKFLYGQLINQKQDNFENQCLLKIISSFGDICKNFFSNLIAYENFPKKMMFIHILKYSLRFITWRLLH